MRFYIKYTTTLTLIYEFFIIKLKIMKISDEYKAKKDERG